MGDDVQASAEALFDPLTQAETWMIQAALRGEMAVCGRGHSDALTISHSGQSEEWAPQGIIRADIIRWLCRDENAASTVDSMGLRVYGAKISGPLDLSYSRIRFPFIFQECTTTVRLTANSPSVTH
jgi:hypothetical protein